MRKPIEFQFSVTSKIAKWSWRAERWVQKTTTHGFIYSFIHFFHSLVTTNGIMVDNQHYYCQPMLFFIIVVIFNVSKHSFVKGKIWRSVQKKTQNFSEFGFARAILLSRVTVIIRKNLSTRQRSNAIPRKQAENFVRLLNCLDS